MTRHGPPPVPPGVSFESRIRVPAGELLVRVRGDLVSLEGATHGLRATDVDEVGRTLKQALRHIANERAHRERMESTMKPDHSTFPTIRPEENAPIPSRPGPAKEPRSEKMSAFEAHVVASLSYDDRCKRIVRHDGLHYIPCGLAKGHDGECRRD